ncbi:phosphatase PAP2 family protein [Streptomyces sp. NBC_00257]|uniref:phosphatase PAP2 family protein n=1 Tax=unclassified Streptomyces TaxID=2593676 RepID=UPI002254129B|nr:MULTISPECIES: phosphatase PAP2 family protein [unclassified Streptomyces]WTB52557.1 phosphatase PAP2 family protein [Streptomyces sp. NBC_00826]WTH94551.1 phosphatase PAP2 family protein [Streptomyces sp. NBC_00825]WTI03286.1 phosphatase PAP2 family protein [Streptomyces sp. NBC_00822]MCX4868835.1 phosphatase PAP2 family protein [Streptomyces sp. NBC_00906]MCX4900073.1 phosphatase PAP2 family protein [Streptomyces sp. NBC_00892]
MPSTQLPPPVRTPPRVTPFGTGAVCALLALVVLVLVAVRWSPLMTLDRTVADALHRRAVTEPGLVHANRILTDWAWDPWTMRALITVAVVALWWRGERLLAVWVAATGALGTVVQQGLKSAVGRERPQWPDPVDSAHYAAFPSGHAMTATVSCGLLLWLLHRHGAGPRLWRTALVVACVSVVGVGVTRLYLGVHWLSDVLGGWLLGAALVGFAIAGFDRYERRGGFRAPGRS